MVSLMKCKIQIAIFIALILIPSSLSYAADSDSASRAVYFKPASLELADMKEIQSIAAWIAEEENAAVLVEGCYCREDMKENAGIESLLALCERRANVVARELIKRKIRRDIIHTIAHGKSDNPDQCAAVIKKVKQIK